MKKIILTLLLTVNLFAFNSVKYFAGVNGEGELTIENKTANTKEKYDQDYSFSAGAELEKTFKGNKFIALGLGAKYEKDFAVKSANYGEIDFASTVPLYAMGKIIIPMDRYSRMYVKGEAGYNFVVDGEYLEKVKDDYKNSTIKVDGGLYSGFGLGFDINNFNIELLYNTTRVNLIWDKVEREYSNSKISASLGYKFGL